MSPQQVVPDATLVDRVRQGDASAFDMLVRRYFRRAYLVALGQLGTVEDAEDACQDAFIRALERIDDCRRPERFAAWLFQIVRNRAHNLRDYRRVRDATDLDTVNLAGADATDRAVDAADLRKTLEAALGGLRPVPREVVLLHDLEGWKHREIAEHLGISEGMSRQHLFAARRLLRTALGSGALREHLHA